MNTQRPGSLMLPLFYADFLTVSGRPDLDGQFFDCVTYISDDSNSELLETGM